MEFNIPALFYHYQRWVMLMAHPSKPSIWRQRQEDLCEYEFQDSQNYTERHCIEQNKTNK